MCHKISLFWVTRPCGLWLVSVEKNHSVVLLRAQVLKIRCIWRLVFDNNLATFGKLQKPFSWVTHFLLLGHRFYRDPEKKS